MLKVWKCNYCYRRIWKFYILSNLAKIISLLQNRPWILRQTRYSSLNRIHQNNLHSKLKSLTCEQESDVPNAQRFFAQYVASTPYCAKQKSGYRQKRWSENSSWQKTDSNVVKRIAITLKKLNLLWRLYRTPKCQKRQSAVRGANVANVQSAQFPPTLLGKSHHLNLWMKTVWPNSKIRQTGLFRK